MWCSKHATTCTLCHTCTQQRPFGLFSESAKSERPVTATPYLAVALSRFSRGSAALSLFSSGISNVNICGVFFAKPLNLCTTADSHLRRRPMDRVLEYRYGNKVMWHMAQACGVGVTIAGLVAVSSSFGPYNNMDRLEQLCGTHSCPDDASAVCCSTRLGLNASGCSNYVAARCGVELPRPVALPCGAVRGCSAVAAEFTGALLLLLGGLTLLGVATAAYLKCCACFARTRSERVKEETPVGRHAASTLLGGMGLDGTISASLLGDAGFGWNPGARGMPPVPPPHIPHMASVLEQPPQQEPPPPQLPLQQQQLMLQTEQAGFR